MRMETSSRYRRVVQAPDILGRGSSQNLTTELFMRGALKSSRNSYSPLRR